MSTVTTFVPGKLFLTGEHSVVHFEPALLTAIGLRTTAKVTKTNNNEIRLYSRQLQAEKVIDVESLKAYWHRAERAWQDYQVDNTDEKLKELQQDRFMVLLAAAGKFIDQCEKLDSGFTVAVDSELPEGSGLGSSASVAVAIIGALGNLFDEQWDLDKLYNITFEVEKIAHGNPSGADNTTVIFGGVILFRKSENGYLRNHLEVKKDFAQFVLVNSGKPKETTREMVRKVGKDYAEDPNFPQLIKRMGQVSQEFIEGYRNGIFKSDLIRENERLLEKIGVVGTKAREMVRGIENMGGVAKICGAGGIAEGSGILLTYHPQTQTLLDFLQEQGWDHFFVEIGTGGIQWRQ